jgi:hypothetical protein
MKKQPSKPKSESIRDKLNLQAVILRQVDRMGNMLTNPAVSWGDRLGMYNFTCTHLAQVLNPYADEKYAKEYNELLKEKSDGKISTHDYTVRLFAIINDLIKRLGLGLSVEDDEEL